MADDIAANRNIGFCLHLEGPRRMSPPNCCYCFICKKSLSFADGIHFFIFPWKHPQKLQKWFTSLNLADKPNSLQPTLRSHICSLHFRPDDLKRCGKRVRLLPQAVPQLVDGRAEPVKSKTTEPLLESVVSRLCPRDTNDQHSNTTATTTVSRGQLLHSSRSGSTVRLKQEAFPVRPSQADNQPVTRIVQPCTMISVTEPAHVQLPATRAADDATSAEPMQITVEIDPFDLGEDSDCSDGLEDSDAEIESEQKCQKTPNGKNADRLDPASCAPEDSDTPCDMKRKIAVLYSAYQTLKKRNKTALQSIRRLKKENGTLKTMLDDIRMKDA